MEIKKIKPIIDSSEFPLPLLTSFLELHDSYPSFKNLFGLIYRRHNHKKNGEARF